MVTASVLHSGHSSCVATVGTHVNRLRLLELRGRTGAGVFMAAGATDCAISGRWVTTPCWLDHLRNKWMTLLFEQNLGHFSSESCRVVH